LTGILWLFVACGQSATALPGAEKSGCGLRLFLSLAITQTVCCSLVRQPAEVGGDIKNRASGFLQLPPLSRFLRSPGFQCAAAHGWLPPPSVKRAANGRVTDSGFKKSYEHNKFQK
jgi:hypothetical protein